MTAEQQQRVEEIRARDTAGWKSTLRGTQCCDPRIDGAIGAAIEEIAHSRTDIPFLLNLLREQQAERLVKVKIGAGALTRDLVWCECGRGISATGNWVHCPKCGGKIDQESYREATRAAFANGLYVHHDADLINQIAEQQAELDKLRHRTDDTAPGTMTRRFRGVCGIRREACGA